MNEFKRHQQTSINVQKQANLIWNVADILRGLYKPHEYGKVILPMTVIKRLHDTLLKTREEVLKTAENTQSMNDVMRENFLKNASGYSFYNTSLYTFETLLADPANIESNFRAYLNGFSENMQDILDNFKFDVEITTMADNDALFYVIQEFNKADAYLGPDKMTSTDMGYVFEELVRKFSESYNEEAGAHFTSRDIIYLMTDLLLIEDKDTLFKDHVFKTVYDQTMGTSQMLSAMTERIHDMNDTAEVATFGQELNPETYAIAKADTMIRGGDPENMALGSTLTSDQFEGFTFDYCISNPPFGVDWKKDQKAVKAEHELGELGRFGVGLPRASDGQLLFLLNGISKLKETGRMAIIHNGSALFSGNPGGGESSIRQYVIENDWLEGIIQLPNDLFYNTGIATYIWIITKDKSLERQGKVQLVDASNMYEKRRKNIGEKRVDISEACREKIVQAYGEFDNKEYHFDDRTVESKILSNESFGFTRVTIERPERNENGDIVYKKNGNISVDTNLRDTEDIPLTENINEYFEREVLPFSQDAWMNHKKDKIGYEIPFTRLFYKYTPPEPSEIISERIKQLEESIVKNFQVLSGKEVDADE
ncbi:class I SAM-dependent DNA methyltransferase [Staphylococcus epidermidis]|uniref:type I restriction-modification system subunit M n=1 Tax=Staphylococcus epidermidis TaxID=1282 RepID=UPI001886E5A3|nr:class I SAM-dependent DNA methyltransferase [Staphylococcus epidermidis]MBF2297080.1 SAM-dependent DNA methyltransferase [Staphylococcus epidermidis]MBF2306255.1 SAM-dependent DNA methyltransferase [Staphylococcus epidermidis]MBF2315266.1 SAM-dependent DNA methyltransferase [Staphylococcus epidermidis]MBM0803420.1 SAM-dependent DNA methyltransferase [Staphylococcus epidermidis]MCG1085871.1 type I restriction-modification system subunit M [Staphylococcus epidermidis]